MLPHTVHTGSNGPHIALHNREGRPRLPELVNMEAVTFRKLTASDRPALEAHLLRLDAESRRLRFGTVTRDEFLIDYAERCFRLDAVLHGAVAEDRIVGAGELRPFGPEMPDEAEIAFSVDEDMRGRGIGGALFERIILSARNRGWLTLYMTCLTDNLPMQAVARRFSARLSFATGDLVGRVEAPRRTVISILSEVFEDAAALRARARKALLTPHRAA